MIPKLLLEVRIFEELLNFLICSYNIMYEISSEGSHDNKAYYLYYALNPAAEFTTKDG